MTRSSPSSRRWASTSRAARRADGHRRPAHRRDRRAHDVPRPGRLRTARRRPRRLVGRPRPAARPGVLLRGRPDGRGGRERDPRGAPARHPGVGRCLVDGDAHALRRRCVPGAPGRPRPGPAAGQRRRGRAARARRLAPHHDRREGRRRPDRRAPARRVPAGGPGAARADVRDLTGAGDAFAAGSSRRSSPTGTWAPRAWPGTPAPPASCRPRARRRPARDRRSLAR